MDEIDLSNKFRVANNANGVVTMTPVPGFLSYADAVHLAACLVIVVDPDGKRFSELLGALRASKG